MLSASVKATDDIPVVKIYRASFIEQQVYLLALSIIYCSVIRYVIHHFLFQCSRV